MEGRLRCHLIQYCQHLLTIHSKKFAHPLKFDFDGLPRICQNCQFFPHQNIMLHGGTQYYTTVKQLKMLISLLSS